MKKTRLLSLLLVLVMLFSTLASCGGGDQTTTTTQATTTTTTTANPYPSVGDVPPASDPANDLAHKLIDEGFVIVGAESASNAVNTASATVINTLKAIDKWISIDDDFDAREAGAKEIQIGVIRRDGTQAIASALTANRVNSSMDWRVTVTADTVNIVGASDDALVLALGYFNKMLAGEASAFYPAYDSGIQRYDWPLTLLGNVPVEQYKIVLAQGASDSFSTLATNLQSAVFQKSGFTLPIIDDSSASGSCELVIGKTARPVSASALSALKAQRDKYTYDGFLYAEGTQISIFGDEIDSAGYALRNFLETYLNADKQAELAGIQKLYAQDDVLELTFTAFSDFHYIEGSYISPISDIHEILARAQAAGSSFVIQAGDHSNDYKGSPELMQAYLQNDLNLPAYGIYGNHELENGNAMSNVTPLLTNRNDEVVWGTADGKIAPDGSIAYYYFESNGFRIICTDTNYSWNPTGEFWEHNRTFSYGPPAGNTKTNSLGPTQLAWLEEVLMDAANKGTPCIVLSHAPFGGGAGTDGDGTAVRELFAQANAIHKGTVLMAINGHMHTNHVQILDDVLFLDLNTVRNGDWQPTSTPHYTEDQTFEFTRYDSDGNPISTVERPLTDWGAHQQTWFFADPTSAVITVSSTGRIIIDGITTTWLHDVVSPNSGKDGCEPLITSGTFDVFLK